VKVNATKPVVCSAPSGNSDIAKNTGETFTIEWCGISVTNCNVTGPGPDNGPTFSSNECSGKFTLSKQSSGTYEYKMTGMDANNGKPVSGIATVNVKMSGGTNSNNNTGNSSSVGGTGGGVGGGASGGASGGGGGGSGSGSFATSTCSISSSSAFVVASKNTAILTWVCDSVIDGCAISDDNAKTTDIGAVASSDSKVTPPIDKTTKFTLQCPDANDASVIVKFFAPLLKEVIPQ